MTDKTLQQLRDEWAGVVAAYEAAIDAIDAAYAAADKAYRAYLKALKAQERTNY